MSFENRLSSLESAVNDALETYMDTMDEHCPDMLRRAMRYSLLSGGKRIRPILALLSTRLCGGDEMRAMPAACAVEMAHCFSLIHDDLPAMDDDELRRGMPTNHRVFGEDQAILAGDALLAYAFDVLAADLYSRDGAADCCAILARSVGPMGMTGGQSQDMQGLPDNAKMEDLRFLHSRKTGALIDAAVHIGAVIAGASSGRVDALRSFATHFGLLFQITDDIIDHRGTQKAAGKAVGKDARCGKATYVTLLGIEQAEHMADAARSDAMNALSTFGTEADILRHVLRDMRDRTR